MKLYIHRRIPGTQPGGKGGWIRGGLERIETRDNEPEQGWEFYLLENYGPGEYAVSTHGSRGQFFSVFHGEVRGFESDGVVA